MATWATAAAQDLNTDPPASTTTTHWLLGGIAVLLAAALARQTWRVRRASTQARRTRELIEQSPHLVAYLDEDDSIRELNHAGRQWLGLGRAPLTHRRLDDLPAHALPPSQAARLAQALARSRQSPEMVAFELHLQRRSDGALLALDLNIRRRDATTRLLEGRDITLRKSAEEKLRLAATFFEQAREGFAITDAEGVVISVNPAMCEITGYAADELIGRAGGSLGFAEGDPAVLDLVRDALARDGHWEGEVRSARKDGSLYTSWAGITLQRDPMGAGMHYTAIVHDLTAFREAEQRLVRIAHLDAVTGLPNRALLADRVGQLTGVARRAHRPFVLMFMDLDQFKHVNDTLGHSVGDALLAEIGQRLKTALRDCDTVARLGGDEYAVLLPGTDADGAALVAAKLLAGMALPCHAAGHELGLTMSIGLAVYPGDGEDFETLSRNADTAMYRAKQEGRATWCFYSADMQRRSARQLQLDTALRRAVERRELLLHYQPQLSGDGRRLVGLEALVRWKHPELGMVSPGEFIPLAESNGMILSIGEWVLRTAVTQLQAWREAGVPDIVVAVNLSAAQFRHPALTSVVSRALQDAGLPAHLLELELTESVAAGNPQAAIATMDALHAMGVRMSIDDFGTGYSSLSYLKRFPIHTLKIDQSFVRDIDTDPDDRAIVQAIIQLARSLQLQTLAEGVETDAQHAFLRSNGCDMVQGYRFCRPIDATAIPAWIAAHAAAQAAAEPAGTHEAAQLMRTASVSVSVSASA